MAMKSVGVPNVKTSIRRVDLISRLEKLVTVEKDEHAKAITAYEKAKAKYERDVETHIKKRFAELPKELARIAIHKGWRYVSNAIVNAVEDDFPESPDKPDKCGAGRYEYLIEQLKLSSDDELKLTPEDFRSFMQGDQKACRC